MLRNHKICALAYEGLCTFEFAIAVETFALSRPELSGPWYDFKVVAAHEGPFSAMGGIEISTPYTLEELPSADTIIIPGWTSIDTPVPAELIAALKKAHARGCRIVTICSGVFVLAATDLLDGKSATTHWRYAEALAKRYPAINVDPDVLYVDEGSILTSAGSAAGLDLCIHLIRRDYGAEAANTVARRFVLPAHRDGGQAQFIPRPVAPSHNNLSPILDELRANLDRSFPVPKIAAMAHMSPRTLIRHFKKATGLSPQSWLTRTRIEHACDLLETTNKNVDQIATACGFGTPLTLRYHFRRFTGVAPMQYRASFRARDAA